MQQKWESSHRRAIKDTEQFRSSSKKWFWGCEVIGSGSLAGLAAYLTYGNLTRWQLAIVTALVFIGGFFIIYGIILAVNLIRAPYKQRNELRAQCEPFTRLKQKESPQAFISIQPFSIYLKKINSGMQITAVDIRIRSWLFEEITISRIRLELLLPLPSSDGRFTHRKAIFLEETNKFAINNEESRKNLPNITLNCQDKDLIISSRNVNKTFQIEGTAWLWINTLPQLQIPVISNVQFIVPGEFEG